MKNKISSAKILIYDCIRQQYRGFILYFPSTKVASIDAGFWLGTEQSVCDIQAGVVHKRLQNSLLKFKKAASLCAETKSQR